MGTPVSLQIRSRNKMKFAVGLVVCVLVLALDAKSLFDDNLDFEKKVGCS